VDAVTLAARPLGLTVHVKQGVADRAERRQWAAAEAIGEHLKPQVRARLGVERGAVTAKLIAARLLLPEAWFPSDAAACAYDLARLKERYRTASHEALAWRLLDLPEPCVITVVDDGHVYRRRSNAWRVKKQLAEPEKRCEEHVRKHGEQHEVRAAGWTVRGWPVPHEGWPRVILRSVADAEALHGGREAGL
jgi:hypothetical protein